MVLKNLRKKRDFSYKDFYPQSLVKFKRQKGLSVSVVVPTLNEEKTIGKLLKTIQTSLMVKDCPLVDELMVIDSGSADRTWKETKARGVRFLRSSQVYPELKLKPAEGKGENLWRSLFVAKGDLIVWIDADVLKPHPAHVYGLLGPLLINDKIKFTKAYFPRYTQASGKRAKKPNGGRMTEILARPTLNLIFPELVHLYQPCNGNVAGKKEVLRNLEFPTKYSVDLALAIDIAMKYGPESIAQVYCPPFKQEGQGLQALGKMSFQNMRTVLYKARDCGRLSFDKNLPSVLKQAQADSLGSFRWTTKELVEIIRAPVSQFDSLFSHQDKGFASKPLILFKLNGIQAKLKEGLEGVLASISKPRRLALE